MPLQRLFETSIATATSTGTAQFNFPTPPTMLVWEGSLGIVGPPLTASFFALVGGSQWCSWSGNNIGGPVQALPGEQVLVTATGLTANTEYTAQWIGFSLSRNEATLKYPAVSTNSSGGSVVVPVTGTPSFGQQKVATGGTAVQLTSTPVVLLQGVAVQALKANTDQVYLGVAGVNDTHDGTGNGWELQPGQCSPVIPATNVNLLYINSATAGSAVCWTGV